MMFLTVYLIYASLDYLLYLAKPTTTIDHSAPVEKLHVELNLWPWSLSLTLNIDLDLKTGWKTTKCHIKTRFLTVWPWPLTYNLDLQSKPSRGQGQTVQAIIDGRTDGRYQTYYLPCFAVDNKSHRSCLWAASITKLFSQWKPGTYTGQIFKVA